MSAGKRGRVLKPWEINVVMVSKCGKPPPGDPLASSGGSAQTRGEPWKPRRQALETLYSTRGAGEPGLTRSPVFPDNPVC